jgi:predicted TIM-barrel fold metal-dependent hydrolase
MSEQKADSVIEVNPENQWRLVTPGSASWPRSPRPNSNKRKYFMVTVDSHMSPPPTLFRDQIDKKFIDRLPRFEVRDGKKFIVQEGLPPARVAETKLEGEDELRTKAGAYLIHDPMTIEERHRNLDLDGVDGEIIFPNGAALLMFTSRDAEFLMAQARIWNDWLWQECAPYKHRTKAIAAIPTIDIDMAVAEVQRVAKMGYDIVMLPNKPVFGPPELGQPNYNLPEYDRLWAAIQDADLAITFHVSTGQDPRTASGNGGAILNYCIHSLGPTIEPVVALCASGVIERFPGIRFATIEANGGWAPWLLDRMDEAYRTHHFWVRPKLKNLPSDYYRSNGAASVGEDRAALMLAEAYGLENNFMWANDYPHHEGTWPHSAESIERTCATLKEETRKKILGLNAARFFKFDIPKHYLD